MRTLKHRLHTDCTGFGEEFTGITVQTEGKVEFRGQAVISEIRVASENPNNWH